MAQRILVVDDERIMAKAMTWELKGFDVTIVTTLSEAMLALCREQFDAIICDWDLGREETGEKVLQVAAKLNKNARRFIVSGLVPDALGPLLVSGVAHRYIAKPWNPHDVRDAVREELHAA
ncbi:MAG: response regulator [Myxococcaceae bacterium]|nr:response regulator [Myxococcaceae bacterium]